MITLFPTALPSKSSQLLCGLRLFFKPFHPSSSCVLLISQLPVLLSLWNRLSAAERLGHFLFSEAELAFSYLWTFPRSSPSLELSPFLSSLLTWHSFLHLHLDVISSRNSPRVPC